MPRLKTAFLSVALVVTSLGATSFTRSTGAVATSVIAAVDCSQGAVQAALDDADDGDTVRVPAGICAWADGVAWTNKNVRLQGAGIDQTIVDCDECVRITSTAPTSAYSGWRLSGFTFRGAAPGGIVITIWDNVDSWHYGWRIDHIELDYPGAGSGYGIFVAGATYGVIDSSVFKMGGGLAIIAVGQMSDEWPGSATHPQGGYLLSQPLDLGSFKAVYIEDNVFTGTAPGGVAAYDTSSGGARAVFRHNTVNGGIYYSHWTRNREVGGILHEIYNNTFIGNANFDLYPIRLEAGTGVIFNNTVQGYANLYAVLDERRGFYEDDGEFGACDGSKAWDGNAGDPAAPGWPCLGQIGRAPGKTIDQILAGDKQDSAPLYLWNNGVEAGCRTGGACSGAFGISVWDGSAAARAYVSTSAHPNGEVDVVLNGSTPRPGYTPYTYPHPLRAEVQPAFTVRLPAIIR